MRDLGYYYHPPSDPTLFGHPQLDIQISTEPTERHYDPENASFLVFSPEVGMDRLIITHPWRGPRRWQVLAGRIILEDRREKIVEAFSFGGELQITVEPTFTFCQLRSPAPILPIERVGEPLVMIASQFEALMAIYKTDWKMDDAGFYTCLAQTSPDDLFYAGLFEVRTRFEQLPVNARGDHYWEAWNDVEKMLAALKQQGEAAQPLQSMQELLEKFCA